MGLVELAVAFSLTSAPAPPAELSVMAPPVVVVSAPAPPAAAAPPAAPVEAAAAPEPQAVAPSTRLEDPLEGANRRVYRLNQSLDRYLLRPVAVAYRRWLPRPVRKGVHNALRNWDEPGVVVNDVLQRRFSDAGRSAYRFGVNTTIGVVGVFDVAGGQGVVHHENGFALTLARYRIGNGAYLYLPFAGPSTVRELFGAVVDLFTNPLTNIRRIRSVTLERAQTVASIVDTRATVDEDLRDIAVTATDPYASIRSIYLQTLASQVRGDVISLEDSPDIPGAPDPPDRRRAPDAPPASPPNPTPSPPTPSSPTPSSPTPPTAAQPPSGP